jgi:hypothetical protein
MKPKSKPMPTLYIVWALCSPGPKWQMVSEPKPRSELVLIVRDQWKQKRLARIRPAPARNQEALRESK